MKEIQNSIDALFDLLTKFDFVDLAPILEEGIPKFPSHPPLEIEQTFIHERDGFFCQTIRIAEHVGTHVDAPAHMQSQMMEDTVEKLPADYLIAPAVVYDIASLNLKAGENATLEDILLLEKRMGMAVKPGEIALLHYGWEKYWGIGEKGDYYSLNEPGLNEAAAALFAERRVKAVGSDTVGCDSPIKDGVFLGSGYGHDTYWLKNHILIMEVLMNLDKLPPRCYFLALPLKIKNGSGSPIRPIALIPKEK